MLSRKKNVWISLLCMIIAAALVYVLYMVQLRYIQFQETMDIVAPNQFIPAGTLIEESMISYRLILRDAYDRSMISSKQQVVGFESAIPLGKDEPILAWKLNRFQLYPDEHQATFQIPKSYLLSVSSGIRAGDRVAIYISGGEQESRRLFPQDVTVVSVKSSAYKEVDDQDHAHMLSMVRSNEEMMYVTRRNASAPIDHINLNLTEQEWLQLDSLCNGGEVKLVIAFSGEYVVSPWRDGG